MVVDLAILLLFIVIPQSFNRALMWSLCSCPFLATRINPIIPIVGAILYFFTMSSLLRTTFTDPGVIPRASYDEAAYIEKQIGKYPVDVSPHPLNFLDFFFYANNRKEEKQRKCTILASFLWSF